MPKDIADMTTIAELDEQERQIVSRQLELQTELDRLDNELYEVNRQQIAADAP